MKLPKMSFAAAGDMLIQRCIPVGYEGFQEVSDYIHKADASFFNLETTLHHGEFWGNQFYGGSFLRADPKVLDIAKAFGFNMLSFNNNHTFDFGYGGLQATLQYVREAGFVNAGVGMNLEEAAGPAYLETTAGRVALISAASSIENPAAMAGQQSRRFIGRPGLNGLRIEERVEVTPEQFKVIQEIARDSLINAKEAISRAEGYTQTVIPEGVAQLKGMYFVSGGKAAYHTYPNKEDMARVERAIYEAQVQADYILVSIHAHEIAGTSKETPAEFLVEFAHRCIDAGAHAVIGHGPHLLRPVEIYQNCPIFYSLGDFVLHNESMDSAPEAMYQKYGMTSDTPIRDLFCKRDNNYTRGLLSDPKMMEAVVPYFEMEDGVLTHLEFMPVALGIEEPRWRNGNPRFASDRGIIERLSEMSTPYGTKISINDKGFGVVDLT